MVGNLSATEIWVREIVRFVRRWPLGQTLEIFFNQNTQVISIGGGTLEVLHAHLLLRASPNGTLLGRYENPDMVVWETGRNLWRSIALQGINQLCTGGIAKADAIGNSACLLKPCHLQLWKPQSDGIALDANFHETRFCWRKKSVGCCSPSLRSKQRPKASLAVFLFYFFWLRNAVGFLVASLAVRPSCDFAFGRSFVSSAHVRYFLKWWWNVLSLIKGRQK